MRKVLESLKAQKIGLFDSGIGGLSILNKLLNLDVEEFIYVADTKYLPYGEKSPEFLVERGKAITQYFLSQNITTIIVACHTSSALSLPSLQIMFPQVLYIDMLAPTIDKAIKQTKNNNIGVMATQATINSHVHKKLLLAQNLSVIVTEQACPDFVFLIERNGSKQEFEEAIEKYLSPLLRKNLDTLVLGCTHYAFLQSLIAQKVPSIQLISAASCLDNLQPKKIGNPQVHIKSTGPAPIFDLVNVLEKRNSILSQDLLIA